MTRCLDCGSERTTDQCPSCGLTSAAAEVMFRRRSVFRTAIFLLGSLAFPYVSQIFPPLDIDLMLIFFGVIFFTALFLGGHSGAARAQSKGNRSLKAHLHGIHPAALDSRGDALRERAARQREKHRLPPYRRCRSIQYEGIGARYAPACRCGPGGRGRPTSVWLWTPTTSIAFNVGDLVEVAVEPGALGIPWYYGVYRR